MPCQCVATTGRPSQAAAMIRIRKRCEGRAMTKVLHALAVPLWFAPLCTCHGGLAILGSHVPRLPASAVAAVAGRERLFARFERLCTNGR